MSCLTSNDKKWGPFTWGRSNTGNWWHLTFNSAGEEDRLTENTISFHGMGFSFRITLPAIIQPFKVRVHPGWDDATIKRLGHDWYDQIHERQYGVSLMDGHLSIFYGVQFSGSLGDDHRWSYFLPWTQWRFVRESLFDAAGEHYWTRMKTHPHLDSMDAFRLRMQRHESCPSRSFELQDYDGTTIIATTRIEEREWRFGTGWFKWLSWFRRAKVVRSLDLRFSAEVGPEKGTWKGGTIGHSIEMTPGETHEAAFRRYCDEDHKHRGKKYRLTFIGPCPTPPPKPPVPEPPCCDSEKS